MVAIDGLYGLFRPAWQANTRIYLGFLTWNSAKADFAAGACNVVAIRYACCR